MTYSQEYSSGNTYMLRARLISLWKFLSGISQDCRDVEELVKRTFEAPDSPTAQIVYVGQRVE
jgi:hypothetical protein